uniref:DDE-type integrase/transposase/recombinase n=1 Tax=Paraburkholderia sp. RL18-101-BIB-B TaxID=3031634 RepID=UPI0038BCBB2E
MDETYLKIRGRWVYLYRAVDRADQTVDLSVRPFRSRAQGRHRVLGLECAPVQSIRHPYL